MRHTDGKIAVETAISAHDIAAVLTPHVIDP